MSSVSLESRGIAEARLTFHPAVHKFYGEQLYYFAMRSAAGSRAADEAAIANALGQLRLDHYCLYPAFGYFDYLLRVWMTGVKAARLRRAFAASPGTFSDVRDLDVEEVRYLWSDTPARTEDLLAPQEGEMVAEILRHEQLVLRVAAAETPLAEDVEALLQDGLLLCKPPTSGSLKVYVALQRFPSMREVGPREELETVLGYVDASVGSGRAPSLYTGRGRLSTYLLKFVCDDFQQLQAIMAGFDPALERIGLRPMTLLMADPNVTESDNLNSSRLPQAEAEAMSEIIGEEYDVELSSLDEAQARRLRQIVQRLSALRHDSPTTWEATLDLIRASLRKNEDEIGAVLGRLTLLEPRLRSYSLKIWGQYLPNWHAIVSGEFQRLEGTQRAKIFGVHDDTPESRRPLPAPDDWSLGAIAWINELLSKHLVTGPDGGRSTPVGYRLASDLGSDWHARIRKATMLRNEAFHGRFVKWAPAYDLGDGWGDMVEGFITTAALHEAVFRATQDSRANETEVANE